MADIETTRHGGPFDRMRRLTGQVMADRASLADTWKHTDPETPDLPSGDKVNITRSETTDRTLAAIATAVAIRQRLLRHLIEHTRDLVEHVDQLGYPLPATVDHLEELESYLPDPDRPDLDSRARVDDLPTTRNTLAELLALHRGAWQLLHDHTMRASWDGAEDLLHDFDRPLRTPTGKAVPGHNSNRLAHTLHRITKQARAAIVQPNHPAAGTDRPACTDPLARGCQRFLPIGRERGQCEACKKEKQRRKEREQQDA